MSTAALVFRLAGHEVRTVKAHLPRPHCRLPRRPPTSGAAIWRYVGAAGNMPPRPCCYMGVASVAGADGRLPEGGPQAIMRQVAGVDDAAATIPLVGV